MKKYTTYLYSSECKESAFSWMPEIHGENCIGISNYDVFKQRDTAQELLEKIADNEIDDPAEAAAEFLKGAWKQ